MLSGEEIEALARSGKVSAALDALDRRRKAALDGRDVHELESVLSLALELQALARYPSTATKAKALIAETRRNIRYVETSPAPAAATETTRPAPVGASRLPTENDPSDPGSRAASRLARRLRAHELGRMAATFALVLFGLALVIAAEPVTGVAGARVGAIVAALCLAGIAAALWPWPWSRAEYQHHQLDSIWREVRTDAELEVPWERYAAWAEAGSDSVHLQLIRCAPSQPRVGGAPSPLSRRRIRELDPEDVEAAAEAMETLRAEAAELEQKARDRHTNDQLEADRRRHEARLAAIDRELEQAVKAGEDRARREIAAQQAADRSAQADTVARALRRP